MNIGKTSFIVFLSKVVASALGFVATIYFARYLGAEVLGIYSGIIALISWLQILSGPGVGVATRKRISEGDHPGEDMTASIVLFVGSFCLITVLLVLFREPVESYLSGFTQYSSLSVVWFIIGILFTVVLFTYVSVVLQGQHRVHIAGFLEPIRTALRSVIQIALVVTGLSLVGMLTGYLLGTIVVSAIGFWFITIRPKWPTVNRFHSILSYAKYSWLAALKSRIFSNLDILVLTALVPASLVGIYSAAWSIAGFISLFGHAVGQAVFPEVSQATNKNNSEEVKRILENAIAFAGVIAIPGFVGGFILDNHILRIYGSEFLDGTEVLWLLLLAVLIFTYMRQFQNALNAMDHPEIAFRVNILFVSANIVLNVSFVIMLGWVGAALASVVSTGFGLIFSYTYLVKTVPVELPIVEITKQILASISMGVFIIVIQTNIDNIGLNLPNFVLVLVLVTLGAAIYGGTLMLLSHRFRQTIYRNIPFH